METAFHSIVNMQWFHQTLTHLQQNPSLSSKDIEAIILQGIVAYLEEEIILSNLVEILQKILTDYHDFLSKPLLQLLTEVMSTTQQKPLNNHKFNNLLQKLLDMITFL